MSSDCTAARLRRTPSATAPARAPSRCELRVLAARGAQLASRAGVSFETPMRVVWGGLLAGDGYRLTTGVIDSIAACTEKHVDERMMRYLDDPFAPAESTCRDPNDAMGRQGVDSFDCALTVATSAISAFAVANGYR